MKVLITGGAGFIGSHLTDRLLNDGHKVVVLDRFTHGKNQHKCSLIHKKNLVLYNIDITKPTKFLTKYFEGIDWVFHLVATKKNNPDPVENHRVNIDSTVYILEASRKSRIKKFIYTGAAACYGNPLKNPVKENDKLQLTDPYTLTKFLAEEYILHWGKVYKLPVIILRLFNTYGPKIRKYGGWGPTLSIFLRQKLEHKPYTITGSGNQLRDFTYIGDATDALIQAAQSDVVNEVINIGSGFPTSVNMMLDILGGKRVYLPETPNQPDKLYPDVKKAERLLNWQAKVTLKEGLEDVLRKFNTN